MYKLILGIASILTAAIVIYGCGKPTKSQAYLLQHYDEVQIEANHCIELAKQNNDIRKNETCMNIVEILRNKCRMEMQRTGNMFGIDCSNGPQMIALAAKGF
jgi:hypothetical protein